MDTIYLIFNSDHAIETSITSINYMVNLNIFIKVGVRTDRRIDTQTELINIFKHTDQIIIKRISHKLYQYRKIFV